MANMIQMGFLTRNLKPMKRQNLEYLVSFTMFSKTKSDCQFKEISITRKEVLELDRICCLVRSIIFNLLCAWCLPSKCHSMISWDSCPSLQSGGKFYSAKFRKFCPQVQQNFGIKSCQQNCLRKEDNTSKWWLKQMTQFSSEHLPLES